MPNILKLSFFLSVPIAGLLVSQSAVAKGSGASGDYSIGIHLGVINSAQPQINEMIKRANAQQGGISTSELNSAYEGALMLQYRFTGTIYALQLRPSFFYQSQDGTGSGGAYKYSLTGFTVFPIFRLYPLENEFMRFYMQLGLGYGRVNGSIEENDKVAPARGQVGFAGGAFGSVAGLGAEFCYSGVHCFSFEGNYRYLTYERNLATSSTGTFDTSHGSLSQYGKGQEVELDQQDLSARMSGLLVMFGYSYWF